MSLLAQTAARWLVITLSVIGGVWLAQFPLRAIVGADYGEVLETARSPDGRLEARVLEEQGFGAITPNIVRVMIAPRGRSFGNASEVLHGSNLRDVHVAWQDDRKLLIRLPCSRYRSQNYYSSADYSRSVAVVISSLDPSCWANDH